MVDKETTCPALRSCLLASAKKIYTHAQQITEGEVGSWKKISVTAKIHRGCEMITQEEGDLRSPVVVGREHRVGSLGV